MPTTRPNILLITTDQQRFDTLAALGNREIYTPHLDWLADEGLAFTRAYTDCPICLPARATIMTGRHAYTLGLSTNNGMAQAMVGRRTLPQRLTALGYQTRAQGKMHFEPLRCHYGFEHMELPLDYYRERHRRPQEGLPKEHGVGENEMTPVISTVHETESLTHWTVQRSIDFLETRDETRPFFLWTSFTKPHPPFDPCANYWALYANREVSAPIHGDWSQTVAGIPQGFLQPTYCLNDAYRMSESQLKDAKRAYYACITQIDYQLGLLFARLRELGLLRNTWIVFTADHGEMLGDHHMGAKTVFLEGSAHIPLLIRPPADPWDKKPLAGTRVDTLAQLADLLPTILRMVGEPLPTDVDGIDLLDPAARAQERVYFGSCAKQQYAVMRGRVKYCFAAAGGCELLFDLASDPQEQRNLAGCPEHATTLRELRGELQRHLARHEPQRVDGDGTLRTDPAIAGPGDVTKWPGFHSTLFPCDVLH